MATETLELKKVERHISHTSSRSSGSKPASIEQEDKQRARTKEKLEKCSKEKLIDFCDVLDIPINKSNMSKEELAVRILELFVYPKATRDIVLAGWEKAAKKRKKSTPETLTSGESSDVPAKRRQTKKPGKKQEQSDGELERTHKRKSDGFLVDIPAKQIQEQQHLQLSSSGSSVQSWSVTQAQMDETCFHQSAPCKKERIYGMNSIQDIHEATSSAPPLPPPQVPEEFLHLKEQIDALKANNADLDAKIAYVNLKLGEFDVLFDILAKDNPKITLALKAHREGLK